MKFSDLSSRPPARKTIDLKTKLAMARLRIARHAAQVGEPADPAWKPDPGPQTQAYLSPADVIGYGGAAGGGKSDLIIGLACTQHQKSIIFRREYPQIKDIIRRAKEITEGNREGFNGQSGMLTLGGGKTIEFGSMKDPDDWEKYKGRPHDLKCVGRGTPVRMASGDYRAIEEIRPGDMVATLEGPRRVTRAFNMGVREAVRVTIRSGVETYSQVQGRTHALLTREGWACHDTWHEVPPVSTCEPSGLLAFCRYSGSSLRTFSTLWRGHARRFRDWARRQGLSLCPEDCRCSSASSSCEEPLNRETEAARSNENNRGTWRRPLCSGVSRALRRLVRLSRGTYLPRPSSFRGNSGAQIGTSLPGYRDGCWSGSRPDGEHLRPSRVVALVCLQRSGDAGEPIPKCSEGDDPEGIPRRTHCTGMYVHPYTKEIRQKSEDTEFCTLESVPIGKRELFDITIESANHYFTGFVGIVNRNCYDEATELLEIQVRSSMAWLRTTDEGQRTRVVMTFNPPTNEDGMWVIRFFAPWLDDTHPNPAKPGELRWYATVGGEETERPDGEPFEDDGETIHPTSRTFFPARLIDNPRLMKTGYGRTLMALPEPLRSQLLHGDFKAGIGSDPWQVIPTAWVEAAQARWTALYDSGQGFGPLTCLGVDVAHGGKDKTCLAPRRGNLIDRLLKYKGSETSDGMSAAIFVNQAYEWGAEINIDMIGWGSSCYERCIDNPPEGFGLPAHPINFSEGSQHRDRSGKYKMVNLRAEAYWRLREELDPENGTGLALPPDPELKSELCSARYEIRPNGIIIEPKDKIKERLGHSPDLADSVALTCLNGAALTVVGGPVETNPAPTPDIRPKAPAWGIPGSLI